MPKSTTRNAKKSDVQYGRTIDHETIRNWVEEQGGCPARVKGTGRKGNAHQDPGMIRIDFPGFSGVQSLEAISWDDFFEKFDESQLALIFDKQGKTRFNKLISRKYLSKDELKTQPHESDTRRAVSRQERAADVFSILKEDHRKVEDLFRQIFKGKRQSKEYSQVFLQIKEELEAHADAEESLFYPVLEEEFEREALVAIEEHRLVRQLLAELEDSLDGENEQQWMAKCQVLCEMVRHHVEEEEGILMKQVQRMLSREESKNLGAMVEEEERLYQEGHTR